MIGCFSRQDYYRKQLATEVQLKSSQLNTEQRAIYDCVIKAVDDSAGGLYFIYSPGGYV